MSDWGKVLPCFVAAGVVTLVLTWPEVSARERLRRAEVKAVALREQCAQRRAYLVASQWGQGLGIVSIEDRCSGVDCYTTWVGEN